MAVSKETIREKYRPDCVLATYRDLMQALPNMNESELLAALDEEAVRGGDSRRDMVWKLHRRYCSVRQTREIEEYKIQEYYVRKKKARKQKH